MKLFHYTILFIILSIGVIFVIDSKEKSYQAVLEEKEVIDRAFDTAIDSATQELLQSEQSRGLVLNKDAAQNEFFNSLYSSLGYLVAKDKQEEIQLYVPMMVVTGEDGYSVSYSDTYQGSDGYTYYSKRWSEKLTYHYEDENFIYGFTLSDKITIYDKNKILDTTGTIKVFYMDYKELQVASEYANFRSKCSNHFALKDESFMEMKRVVITKVIEDSISYYMNIHNSIAFQFGVSYQFMLPIIDNSDFARAIEKPSMIVMFQGYPYGTGLERYNRVSIAGAKLSKNEVYYMEQKGWYFLYHVSTCEVLKTSTNYIDFNAPFYLAEDCINLGAYACERCIRSGAYVPDYMK